MSIASGGVAVRPPSTSTTRSPARRVAPGDGTADGTTDCGTLGACAPCSDMCPSLSG